MRYLFVVAPGRSGSTLMQGLTNCAPRTLVRGENNLFLLPLFRSRQRLRTFHRKFGSKATQRGRQSAFYGLDLVDLSEFDADVRTLVVRQLLGDTQEQDVDTLGFKEVLWHQITSAEHKPFIGFMESVFPGFRVIAHRRRIADVSTSGFWRRTNEKEAVQAIRRVEAFQDSLQESLGDRVLFTRYEAITNERTRDEELSRLCEFLTGGRSEDVLHRMRATMEIGHGPNPFGKSRT